MSFTTTRTSAVAWALLDLRDARLDAVRAPSSGMDALRLGYYCMLLGDEQRTDQYFQIAAKADPGLRPDIAKLRAKDDKPAPSED